MRPKDKLAIFDLDGTLFDTKNVNYNAYKRSIEAYGIQADIDYEYYCNFCNGNNYKVFLPQIVPGITSELMLAIHEKKKQLYGNYLGQARINEHLFQMIDLISPVYLIALVTTASKKNTEDILTAFSVQNKFDLIITQEDVIKIKPDPECFHLAMKMAHVDPNDTIIFEDSSTGLQAAAASGARYVKVYGYS